MTQKVREKLIPLMLKPYCKYDGLVLLISLTI